MSKFTITPPEAFKVSDKIIARQFTPEDADNLLILATDQPVNRYVPWAKFVTDRESAVKQIVNFNATRINNLFARYALDLHGKLVGYVGYCPDSKDGYYEFGFAIMPEYRGQGTGRVTVESLIKMLIGTYHAEGIVAYVDDTNESSKSVVTMLGFTPLEEMDDGDRRYELSTLVATPLDAVN